jgi:AraC-like DNA-binding protein
MKTTIAWVAVVLTFPIILLLWAAESPVQRVCRLRQQGWTQQRIADHLNISRSKVQRMLR